MESKVLRKNSWTLLVGFRAIALVHYGTAIKYTSDIPPSALEHATRDKHGNPKSVTIQNSEGAELHLECISDSALRNRKPRWVRRGTAIEYTGDIPLETLLFSENPNLITVKDTKGVEIQLEYINDNALRYRKKSKNKKKPSGEQAPLPKTPSEAVLIWVYQDSCVVYDREIPEEQSWTGSVKDNLGHPHTIRFTEEEGRNSIILERITENTLKQRSEYLQAQASNAFSSISDILEKNGDDTDFNASLSEYLSNSNPINQSPLLTSIFDSNTDDLCYPPPPSTQDESTADLPLPCDPCIIFSQYEPTPRQLQAPELGVTHPRKEIDRNDTLTDDNEGQPPLKRKRFR